MTILDTALIDGVTEKADHASTRSEHGIHDQEPPSGITAVWQS